MAQYIDKDALVAEIDKLENKLYYEPENFKDVGTKMALDSLKSSLDTLEVKEVDLEKEIDLDTVIDAYMDKNFGEPWDGARPVGSFELAIMAEHFFELGLKAQHNNWKVVDNTNPPQADKNKTYCVFTKGRHILATVINHPQDEDLLQWKCTEFPYHRYDMCEGDKYMQIV